MFPYHLRVVTIVVYRLAYQMLFHLYGLAYQMLLHLYGLVYQMLFHVYGLAYQMVVSTPWTRLPDGIATVSSVKALKYRLGRHQLPIQLLLHLPQWLLLQHLTHLVTNPASIALSYVREND